MELWNQLFPALQTVLSFVLGMAGMYMLFFAYQKYYKMLFKRDEYLAEQNEKYLRILEQTNQNYNDNIAKQKP